MAASAAVTVPLPESPHLVLVTLVPHEREVHLAAALGRNARIYSLSNWSRLNRASGFVPDAVVINPLLCDGLPATVNHALRAAAEIAPLIVYTSVTPTAMRRLLDLSIPTGAKLILEGVDDRPGNLRLMFSALRAATHNQHALDELGSRSGPLPRGVTEALADLLRATGGRLTVNRLARAAHMSARTLERRLAEAHAPPPHWLIKTVRALLARRLLGSTELTVQEVTRRVGYARVSSLRALLRWSFDSPPSLLRRGPPRNPGPRWAQAVQSRKSDGDSPVLAAIDRS